MFRSNLNSFPDAHLQGAFDRIKLRTDGLLDIQTIPNGSLPIKGTEQFGAVSDGELEMGLLHSQYHTADFPAFGVIDVPFLPQNQREKGIVVEAVWPIFTRELAKQNIVPIGYLPFGESGFWTTEDFASIMDVGGAKMRAQAQVYTYILEAINGVPVPVEWGETYTALQRGLIKGVMTGYDSVTGAKIMEVAPYLHKINGVTSTSFICVNKDKWDLLPFEVKFIVMDEISRAMITVQADVPLIIDAEVAKQMAGGLKKYYPNPPDGWLDLMSEKVMAPMLEANLEKAGAFGLEVLAVMEEALGRTLR